MTGHADRMLMTVGAGLMLISAAVAAADTSLEPAAGWPYAGAQAVAVDSARDLVYLGSGGVVLVLDVSDPTAPQLVHDGLHTGGHVRDLRYDAAGRRLYVADWRGGVEAWDLQDPQQPVRISSVPVYYYGSTADFPTDGLALADGLLWVNANDARAHGFDVSDPALPVDVGVQAGPTWYYYSERDTNDVAVADGYLYVVGSGIVRYRILEGGALDKVGENAYAAGARCLEAGGLLAFVGDSDGLGVYDASSPGLPMLGSAAVANGLRDLALRGDQVVAVNRSGLSVFDVSTPQQPLQVATLPLPDGFRVRLDGDTAYVAGNDAGLQVVDLSDPAEPTVVGSYDTPGTTSRVTVAGGHAFLGQSTDGLVIADVSDPGAVQAVGHVAGGAAGESVLVGHYLYVTDWSTPALRVLDVADMSDPVEVGSITDLTPVDLATDGAHLFVTTFSVDTQLYTLRVFDLADPGTPQELSEMPLAHFILEMEYGNGHLFAMEFYDAGLHIIDVSNPANPFEDAFYPFDWGEDVWIQGSFAYVTAFHEGLVVLDVSDPATPVLAGSFHEVFQFDSVAVSGNLAFVTTGTTGEHHLRLYDVGDLDDIHELDRISLPGDAWDLAARDGVAYVADGITGLQVIRAGAGGFGPMFSDEFETGDMSRWSATEE